MKTKKKYSTMYEVLCDEGIDCLLVVTIPRHACHFYGLYSVAGFLCMCETWHYATVQNMTVKRSTLFTYCPVKVQMNTAVCMPYRRQLGAGVCQDVNSISNGPSGQ